MADTGYGCEFGDCTAQPVHLHTDTRTGNTVSLCADHNGPGLIPLVAAELGVDPMAFYTNVEKFIKAEAKKAERELANAQAAKTAESSDDPGTSPDYDPGPEVDDQGGMSEVYGHSEPAEADSL